MKKALIVVAAQEDGPGIGRIRMRQIIDASAESLVSFVRASVEPGSIVHTDGWAGYSSLESNGYVHEVTIIKRKKKTPSELLPRVHRVISLLKRWLLGTHQGAVSQKHLNYYLDEFTFCFNRRRSKSRGKLFFRLAQQAVAVDPVPYDRIVHPTRRKAKPQSVGLPESSGYPRELLSFARDLPKLWDDSRSLPEHKKRILRIALKEIIATSEDTSTAGSALARRGSYSDGISEDSQRPASVRH